MINRLLAVVFLFAAALTPAYAVTNIWQDKLYVDGEARVFAIFDRDMMDRTGGSGAIKNYNVVPTRVLFGAGYNVTPDIAVFARAGYLTYWGAENGQAFITDSLEDKLNFVEGYAEFKNIFDTVDVKLGRQFYNSNEVFYKPLGYSVERLVYAAIDGASAVVRVGGTEVQLLAGKEADLVWGDLGDKYAFGFESKTDVNEIFGFRLHAYNIHTEHEGDYTLMGATPFVNYKNASFFLRYIANREADHTQGQFFHADAKYKAQADSFTLTPKASIMWATGQTTWNTITYLRSIIVEQGLGGAALMSSEIYSAGLDLKLAALPKATFSLDGYHFNSRRNNTPDRGTELDLKAVYNYNKYLEFGIAGGYLFADAEFQDKDTKKLQIWSVLKF